MAESKKIKFFPEETEVTREFQEESSHKYVIGSTTEDMPLTCQDCGKKMED